MTVSSQTSNETFTGNGVTTIWDLPFRFFSNTDVFVYVVDPIAHTTTPLVIGTDYTLTGAGLPEQFGTAPGKITTTVPVANGKQLFVERIMEVQQLTDIINQGRFFPEVHENVFDRLTMFMQQADATLRGAIRVAIGDPEPTRLPSAGLRANLLMGFDSLGNPIPVAPSADSSAALALMLANSVLPTQGAAMIGRGMQIVKNIAELKTLLAGSPSKQAFVTGYYTQGDRGGGHYWLDSSDVVSADNGGTIIVAVDGGRWKLLHGGTIRPEQFGARANGTDDWAFITAAISFIRSIGGGVLDLGQGGKSFQVGKPVKLYSNMRITGRAFIIAKTGFNPNVSFPTFGGGAAQIYNTIAYFNDGAFADDPGNSGYSGLEIDAGVVFYGNYQCDNGLIMEGITNYRISARFQAFNSVGLWAKYYCWGGRINAYISDCLFAMLKLGEAANGIDLNGLQLFGNANNPTYALQIVGDNNGINLSGAFVEKCINGILWTGNSGPSSISGVDFEDCFGTLIKVDGTGLVGRAAGPITITGCFMEATTIGVHAINAIVVATGNRMRDTQFGFVTSGPLARIYRTANVIESTVLTVDTGNVIGDSVSSRRRQVLNHLPNDQLASVEGFAIENNFYSFNEAAKVSGLTFDSVVVDVPTQRMLSNSTWETREMRGGAVFGTCGLKLDYSTGARQVNPRGDNDHSLGSAALRYSVVFAATGTINTSDGRSKQDIREVEDPEVRVAKKLKPLVRAYRMKDSVAEKGDGARIHFGIIAQDVIEAFAQEGLDANRYGLICHDSWDEIPDEKDEAGNVTHPGKPAGERYGIRYDELAMFMISAL